MKNGMRRNQKKRGVLRPAVALLLAAFMLFGMVQTTVFALWADWDLTKIKNASNTPANDLWASSQAEFNNTLKLALYEGHTELGASAWVQNGDIFDARMNFTFTPTVGKTIPEGTYFDTFIDFGRETKYSIEDNGVLKFKGEIVNADSTKTYFDVVAAFYPVAGGTQGQNMCFVGFLQSLLPF